MHALGPFLACYMLTDLVLFFLIAAVIEEHMRGNPIGVAQKLVFTFCELISFCSEHICRMLIEQLGSPIIVNYRMVSSF